MEPIPLLHVADVHLAGSQRAFGDQVAGHQQRIEAAFARCVDAAIARRVQAVLIAGDLFVVPQPSERAVQAALRQLRRLATARPPIPSFILPANHDCLGPGCVYHRPEMAMDGVHIWQSPEPTTFHICGGEVALHGRPQLCDRTPHYALDGLQPDPAARFNVAVAHAAVRPTREATDACITTPEQIAGSGMDYIAFGHWHNPSDQSRGKVVAAFSGSPEILAVDQRERGQAIVVTLSDRGVELEHITVGQLSCTTVELDAESFPDEAAVAAEIASRAAPDLLLDVVISGLMPEGGEIDALRLQDELENGFFRLRVRDESVPATDRLQAEDAAGRLIAARATALLAERMSRCEQSGDQQGLRRARQALRLLLALLHGKEVLQ